MDDKRLVHGQGLVRGGRVNDKPPSVLHRKWRTDPDVGRLLLAMAGDFPSDDDWPIGLIDSAAVAAHVVELHNKWLKERGDG